MRLWSGWTGSSLAIGSLVVKGVFCVFASCCWMLALGDSAGIGRSVGAADVPQAAHAAIAMSLAALLWLASPGCLACVLATMASAPATDVSDARSIPAALPDGLDDCAWQRGSAWQQCAFCVLDHAPDALHADRPLRPALPLRRRCYLKRFGYEIWRADRGQVRSRRLVHWVVVLGMYVDGVTDCVISWYPRLTRR